MIGEHASSSHPPLPPTTEDDRHTWLRLLRSRRVGVSTFYRLLDKHGTAAAALEALPLIAREAGISDYQICPEGVIAAEAKAARRAGARLLCIGDPDYPRALAELDEPPPLLWSVGRRAILRRPMLALVGARNASSLGTRMARTLAKELGEAGFTIVSGLARGVDAAAHEASLTSGTVAVVGGGVDVIYPAENAALRDRIAERGLILSEQPMGLAPMARHFPLRNRIVSGLSVGVIVVEAAARSGTLITAREALDQGREVLAVPGHPMDARAAGCNMLIRDGATLVRGAEDVIDLLGYRLTDLAPVQSAFDLGDGPGGAARDGPPAPPAAARGAALATGAVPAEPAEPAPAPAPLTPREIAGLHARILGLLGPTPLAEDQLSRDIGLGSGTLAPVLLELELDGRISRDPGGLLTLRG